MKSLLIMASIISMIYLSACSSSQQTQDTNTGQDSIYVFDSVPDSESDEIQSLDYPDMGMTYYIVQIGAFTSEERAKSFAEESRQVLPYNVKTSFSRQNNLYVVQISDYYTSRSEAESVRNNLWKNEKFRDAWILTIYK